MHARAARLIEHGQPLQVEEVEIPDPGPGEVLVDMAFGGINPLDRYNALGRVAADAPLPRTIGSEGAGRVDGRTVVVRGGELWATSVVVPAGAVIDVPDGVDLRLAGAVGVAGVTAWRCVTEKAAVSAGDRVLVLGASGGVGSIAVSVAKGIGATVWAQTGSEDKRAWLADRGADEVVVTDDAGLAEAAGALRPTVVIDPLGGGYTGAAVGLLAERGRLVLFGTSAGLTGEVPLQQLYRKGLTVYAYGGLIESDEAIAKGIRETLAAARDGRLEVAIDRVVPLDQVNDAFTLLADRAVQGKLLLDLGA